MASYVISLFRPEIIRELGLPRHGLEILPLEETFTPMLTAWAAPAEENEVPGQIPDEPFFATEVVIATSVAECRPEPGAGCAEGPTWARPGEVV